MNKELPIILLSALLCACGQANNDSSKITSSETTSSSENELVKAFENAKAFGTLSLEHEWLLESDVVSSKDATLYYQIHINHDVVYKFDDLDDDAFRVEVDDSTETYNKCSFSYEFHVYDSNFLEISTVKLNSYDDFNSPENPTYFQGMYIVNHDLAAGDYYFSIKPNVEPVNSTIDIQASTHIGE